MLMKEIILWFSFLVVFLPCFCIILLCFLGWVRKDAFLRISLNLWIESICISATFCQNTHMQTLRLEFALLEESYLQIQFILQIKGYSGYFFLSKVWVSVTFERDCFFFFFVIKFIATNLLPITPCCLVMSIHCAVMSWDVKFFMCTLVTYIFYHKSDLSV